MKKITIFRVSSHEDIKNFHEVACKIYSDDKKWVTPLVGDIERVFCREYNTLFTDGGGGDAQRWIVRDSQGELVGRIAAFYNRERAMVESQPTGGCGFFECIDDFDVSNLLFSTAKEWLESRGMEAMDGPINFGDRMMWWGVLADGFHQPLYGMNYNPPYYTALFEEFGFQNYFNQHTYLRPLEPEIRMPQALESKASRLLENSDYKFKTFDKLNFRRMASDFREVYNRAWALFDGVRPLTVKDTDRMLVRYLPIIDSEVFTLAYYKSSPIGFFVSLPDLNQVISDFKGKLTWINRLKMYYRLRRRKIDRLSGIVFGVVPEFRGLGVEAGLIRQFEQYVERKREQGKTIYKTLQMQWIGDFNPVMMRMCESYVRAVRFKRHITYRYLFDRTKIFERAPRINTKIR